MSAPEYRSAPVPSQAHGGWSRPLMSRNHLRPIYEQAAAATGTDIRFSAVADDPRRAPTHFRYETRGDDLSAFHDEVRRICAGKRYDSADAFKAGDVVAVALQRLGIEEVSEAVVLRTLHDGLVQVALMENRAETVVHVSAVRDHRPNAPEPTLGDGPVADEATLRAAIRRLLETDEGLRLKLGIRPMADFKDGYPMEKLMLARAATLSADERREIGHRLAEIGAGRPDPLPGGRETPIEVTRAVIRQVLDESLILRLALGLRPMSDYRADYPLEKLVQEREHVLAPSDRRRLAELIGTHIPKRDPQAPDVQPSHPAPRP